MGAYVLVLAFVTLTGPDSQRIDINPNQVVATRSSRDTTGEHFAKGVRCLIYTTDGKLTTVIEDCDEVQRRLKGQ